MLSGAMSNRFALGLFVIVAGLILMDQLVWHSGASLFAARKGVDLIQTLAFWR